MKLVSSQELHKLLPNVSLSDQYASVMDWFSQTKLEHLSLQSSFQEIFNFQTQHVIKLHSVLIQYSNTDQTTQESITWKERLL